MVLSCAYRAEAPVVTDAQVEHLTRQLQVMQQQVNALAKAATAQQEQMRQHWQSALNYMHDMQAAPWMQSGRGPRHGAMGPGMMGGGMMGHGGDWMMGCSMTGAPGAGWSPPAGVDVEQYRAQMQQQMQRMQEQMTRIRSMTEPAQRQRLLQEHWQQMYRHMQSMRGMGWMWGGAAGAPSKSLPEPESPGARLVLQYCTQCHATPSPELHSASEWAAVTARMSVNMKNFNASNWRGVKVPAQQEMESIFAYMTKFGRQ